MARTFACLTALLLTRVALAAGSETIETPFKVAEPVIPDRTFDVTRYGAVGDGKTPSGKALNDAIAACGQAGGGRVVVPAGRFLIGRTKLVSNMELHLEASATLLLSDDDQAYRDDRGMNEDCVTADDCHDIAITGLGTIDGQGERWWQAFRKIKGTSEEKVPANHRPFMVSLNRCERVRVEGVTLANSPMFHLVPRNCSDVTIRNLKFKAPENAPNTDALDPSGYRYLITGCTFDTGDDNIAFKPTGKTAPDKLSCEDILVEHCTFLHGHGLSIGGQTPGGLRRLTVRHCTFENTDAGIRMKAARGSGGLVEDLTYSDLTMKNVKVPIYITSYYPKEPKDPAADPAQAVTAKTPIWRNVRIRNVTATDCPEAGRIYGLPEMPVGTVTLTNVNITAKKGMKVSFADDLRFENSSITVESGPKVMTVNAKVSGLAEK